MEGDNTPKRFEHLVYKMRGLRMAADVLHIGAHPDDEDAGLMALLAHKYNVRTVYWSATRGEAGQNRLGAYSGDALGVYRTWESLAARALDGGECLFGPFIDFGFSKNGTEAMAKWGRQYLVQEIVRAIRLVQPLILIARFTGEPSDGHGHHQAVGSATLEAFHAAADATLFTELDLPAWRAPKLYQSTGGDWQPGEKTDLGYPQPEFECDGFVRINTGGFDPLPGLTYQQQAWIAFNSHQTQAMGFLPARGNFYYYYRLKESLVPTKPREECFYDGLDPSLLGLSALPGGPTDLSGTLVAIRASVDQALLRLHHEDPSAPARPLLEGLDLLRGLRAKLALKTEAGCDVRALARQVDRKIADFQEVILRCLGLDAECASDRARLAAGECVRVTATLWNSRGVPIDNSQFQLLMPAGWDIAHATPSSAGFRSNAPVAQHRVEYDVIAAPDAPPTTPYWLTAARGRYRYITPHDFACQAFGPAAITLECELEIGGRRLVMQRPALRQESFPGGYRTLPVSLVPAVSVKPQIPRLFFPTRKESHEIDLYATVHRYVGEPEQTERLHLATPEYWSSGPPFVELRTGGPGETNTAQFRLKIPAGTAPGCYQLEYRIGVGDGSPAVTVEPVWMGAPGLSRPPDASTCIREAFLAKPAGVDIRVIDVKFASGLRYAYVRGAEEQILQGLNNFGLSIHTINDEELGYLELSAFEAIVIGPNAYLIREELRKNAGRFLEYVSQGGTLIVQYQAYGYELHKFAPLPFDYSHPHDRVTDPDAPVTLLEPQHPLMRYPNKITGRDFAGWIHDRGLYFFGTFDRRYTPVLGCNDAGEELKRGGMLTCGYGRGAFVYVAYSLFRQIPAGVPGAFRLMANLLGLPEALLLDRAERLKKLSFFVDLRDDQLLQVARIVSERYEPAGTYLCRQGDPGQELFIIAKGKVEIITRTGARAVSLTASEGQVIGEFAILADLPRAADLRAATEVDLLVMSGVHFRALMRQHVEMAENMIRQLVMKLVVE